MFYVEARPRSRPRSRRCAARTAARRGGRPAIGPELGVLAQVAVLAVVAERIGLGVAGWVVGLAVGVVARTTLRRGLARAGAERLGPANAVTLARTVLVGAVAALAVESWTRAVPLPVVVALAGVALALDAVDGAVARRSGTVSALGARFDMEVDAFLIMVLSTMLVRPVGWWVLAAGAMRYAFVVAGRVLPWLTSPLAPRYSRKVVAAAQGVVLLVAVSGVLPTTVTTTAVAAALAALVWSFGLDVVRLAAGRRPGTDPARLAADPAAGPADPAAGSAEGGQEPVAEGVHAPDRGVGTRSEAVVPAPR